MIWSENRFALFGIMRHAAQRPGQVTRSAREFYLTLAM